MVRPGCFMASVDLKDAYYSVPVYSQDQKYLKFKWCSQYYKYTVFPNGLSICPRKFTKLLKPVYASLRKNAFESIGYLDDSFLKGQDFDECASNVMATVALFRRLGFVVHPEKSVLIPTQQMVFLGFVIDSIAMTVSLTTEKVKTIELKCHALLNNTEPTIRFVTHVIGLLVAAFPGVMYGPLFYRQLESDKSHALKANQGNYDASMSLSKAAKSELQWWEENVQQAYCNICHDHPHVILETDSSLSGWGCYNKSDKVAIGGEWTPSDIENRHINVLELKAALFGLQSFCKHLTHKHIRIHMDNITAVAYLREMGGSKSKQCNDIARHMWLFAKEGDLWLSSAYIKGSLNVIADRRSRSFDRELEWKLNPKVFTDILSCLKVNCEIDLFASRINCQLKTFVSYKPDPETYAVDAFTLPWNELKFYAFPPFSIICRVLQKVSEDSATGVILVPFWPTQAFFPILLRMLISFPVFIDRSPGLLHLPSQPQLKHPLHHKLQLLACVISGNPCKHQAFLKTLKTLYCTPGELTQENNTLATSINGHNFALHGMSLPFMCL